MYNGIGLQSTRGTGTSGHVQRNVAALHRTHRRRTSNPNPNQTLRAALLKKSGDAQRAHEARRKVEVAVAELEEELNARGYDHDTITSMAQRLRDDLLSRGEDEGKAQRDRELENGHRSTDLVNHRNNKLRSLLGVHEGYVEGSGFRNIRPREEKDDVDNHAPTPTPPPPSPPPEDIAPKDVQKDNARHDAGQQDALQDNVIEEKAKVDQALSDTESSALSESSGESDPDDVPDVRTKVTNSDNTEEIDTKRVRLIEPVTSEPHEQDTASLTRSPQKSMTRRTPPRRSEYGRRSRSRSSSPLSLERGRESPYHRRASPRRDRSPYARDPSPRRRDPSPYDRTPPPRKRSRDRSPYDRNPTPRLYGYDLYRRSPYGYPRPKYKRFSRHRRSRYRSRSPLRSRSYSRSRSFSQERRGRNRDESPDSSSTSSRSGSPYGRRTFSPYGRSTSSQYGRSPSPRRRLSPYYGRSTRRRSPSPYSRKRRHSYYSPPRRARYRTQSPEGYRYSRRNDRQKRDRGYSPSDSDSSRSPPRRRTPLRRSRFSDYPSSSSPNRSPRRSQRYPSSPAD